jgi:hypothetical protein
LIAHGREVSVEAAAYVKGEMIVAAWAGMDDPGSGRSVDGDTLFNVFPVTEAVAATASPIIKMAASCALGLIYRREVIHRLANRIAAKEALAMQQSAKSACIAIGGKGICRAASRHW